MLALTAFLTVFTHAGDVFAGGLLSTFSTKYNPNSKNRSHNIGLAADAIDNVALYPGEEFSFNDTVGPTGKDNGYRTATVFFNKEKTKGYGGGICQVSTTLYNAAESAGLDITERHSHSLDITYVEEGRDATTSRKGKLDFKFVNRFDYPILIRAYCGDGTLTVEIHSYEENEP